MSMFASLQYPCRPCANYLRWKNASFPFRALIPAVLVSFLALVLPASGQQVNIINTVAGGGTVNSNPASADIPGPTSLVEDGKGNLYVAAPFSQYVFEISAGVVTQFSGLGYIADHSKPGKANTEPLWNAYGLAVDKQGNIYIADTGNNSIRKIDPSGNLQTIAGVSKPCYQGRCGDNGPALSAKLNAPQGIAVDSAGNIYIADSGDNRIRVIKTNGNIYPFAGNWNVPSCTTPTSPCGDGGPAPKASLNAPVGLALDGKGNVYISDTGDNRVRVVNVKTRIINPFAGTGNSCSPSTNPCGDGGSALQANLGAPRGISVDKSLNVYIADTRDSRIRIVTAGTINTFAGTGVHGFQGDGGSPTSAQLAGPNGVFADSAGNVFISDTGNQRVREVTGGVIQTILGGGNGGDGGEPTAAQLADPYGVAVDSSNNYYIADASNNRIREVSGNTIQTLAGNGLNGYSGDGGPAINAELNSPLGLAVDGSGNIFIADTNNRVVREVSGGNINTFAGTGAPCSPPTGGCGDGGAAADAKLTAPSTVVVDSSGNVFIADPSSQRVREVSSGIITTLAGTGNAGYSGDGGPATGAELSRPTGVAVDGFDNVYIADAGNNVIRCVLGVIGGCGDVQHTYVVGDIITYAYNGAILFQGDGGLAIDASRWNPTHVAVDSRGNLFIGGGNDEVVQRVDLATGIIVTVAGDDKTAYFYGFSGDGKLATKAHIDNAGLAIDSNESLYIADAGNNRIREVANMVPVATLNPKSLNFGDVAVGQQSQPMTVTLTNTGSDDMSLTSITTTGDFSQTNGCASTLAPSQNCTISVTFTPTKKGTRNGQLKVTDNAPLSPQIAKLVGTGT
jgi:trimeric autotransporter adhesin